MEESSLIQNVNEHVGVGPSQIFDRSAIHRRFEAWAGDHFTKIRFAAYRGTAATRTTRRRRGRSRRRRRSKRSGGVMIRECILRGVVGSG